MLGTLQAFAQTQGVVIDSSTAHKNQIVCLPVYAKGFINIVGYQYSLEFNEQVMTFHHAQNFNLPDLGPSSFNLYQPGVVTTAWTDPAVVGVTRENGTILYEVCFTAVGNTGNHTDLTPGATLPPDVGEAGVYDLNGNNLWNLSNNVPGYVEITSGVGTVENALPGASFRLTPNPTVDASKVQLHITSNFKGLLTVSDPLGRTVFEQKLTLKQGEHEVEIPAKVLNTKGMYQVTLRSDDGVVSQMLSAQ